MPFGSVNDAQTHLSAPDDEDVLLFDLPSDYQASAGLHGRELRAAVGHGYDMEGRHKQPSEIR